MGKPLRSEFFRRHSPGPRRPPSFKPCALSRLSREHENPLRSRERQRPNAPEVEKIGFADSCFLQLALILWGWGGALSGAPTLGGGGKLGTWCLREGAWPCLAPPRGGASARAASRGGAVRQAPGQSCPGKDGSEAHGWQGVAGTRVAQPDGCGQGAAGT